ALGRDGHDEPRRLRRRRSAAAAPAQRRRRLMDRTAGGRRRGWWALVALFLLLLPAVTKRLYASDGIQYFSFLRYVWFDHDFSFDNEYRYFDEHGVAARSGFHETFLESPSPTGLRKNFGTAGCAILWAPFYAAGDLTARILRATGKHIELDG